MISHDLRSNFLGSSSGRHYERANAWLFEVVETQVEILLKEVILFFLSSCFVSRVAKYNNGVRLEFIFRNPSY